MLFFALSGFLFVGVLWIVAILLCNIFVVVDCFVSVVGCVRVLVLLCFCSCCFLCCFLLSLLGRGGERLLCFCSWCCLCCFLLPLLGRGRGAVP